MMKPVGMDCEGLERTAQPVLSLELAHFYRSRFLDKCAEAERQVLRILQAAGGRLSVKASLSKKLDTLTTLLAENRPGIPADCILELLRRLVPLSELRTEFAHSTMSLAEVEGECVAVLRNAAEQQAAAGTRTILNLRLFQSRYAEMCDIANQLGQRATTIKPT